MLQNFLSENFRLKKDQIFEGLATDEVESLMGSGVTHLYRKGEVIFREGGIPTGIFYVKTGRIKKYKTTGKGGEQIFYVCSEGELLGYHALLSEEYYPDSAATLEDAEITFIPKENFLSVIRNSTILSNTLLKALGHEFSLFINSITNLATKTVRERLAFNLLILDEKYKNPAMTETPSDINLSRTDLANMVGTAKETLVRLLQEFVGAGLIEKADRSIRIVDRKGMIKEANLRGLNSKKVTSVK
ncbi:Crp/Fnr family transcriptional regulator [Chryseolinea lacunae]|uniref:Crp/Fnr family transcriptional regulator n=1 Tax=Chryseolinea lacunae TaxID=2801331 RepID=A0ABS1L2C1_9BACT|nr:Crp/Fnr family transcriptional regulator [Chryseolinea lacunae]MBL0745730.1 Crp/Fnr family transcriptional regulator [Chryseolinea lacunae]